MADVTRFEERRAQALKDPSPELKVWAKKAGGQVDHVATSGDVVDYGLWPEKPKPPEPIKPAYDVHIKGGAMLDHRNPGIEEGVTREVKPEKCPPGIRPIRRAVAASVLMPYLDAFIVELDSLAHRIAERSDNKWNVILKLYEIIELSRQWREEIRKGQGKMFVSHAMLLQNILNEVEAGCSVRWSGFSPEAQAAHKLAHEAGKWVDGLRLAK